MSAYYFLWNPKKDPDSFTNYGRVLRDAEAGRPHNDLWRCPSKQPQPNEIAIMQRTGPKNSGVFAKGTVTRAAFDDNGTQLVGLKLDSFLPLGKEIPRSQITATAKYKKPWMPMASGNIIPEPLYQAIQALWDQRTIVGSRGKGVDSDSALRAEELVGLEGELLRRLTLHRRRESQLREKKIADMLQRTGRLLCEVPGCSFDFQQVYGELGAGYAQVHHLNSAVRACAGCRNSALRSGDRMCELPCNDSSRW